MDHIKPLVLLLTCDFKDDKLCQLLKEIVEEFPASNIEHAKQVKIVPCAVIFGGDVEGPLEASVAVERLSKIVQQPVHEHDVQVYILYDYPVSLRQFVGLVQNSKDYSILDGIVKLVSKTNDVVKSSIHGPETTSAEVPPPVIMDNEDKAIAKLDIDAVLQNYKRNSGGLWADVTYDEFNIMHKNTFTNTIEDMSVSLMVDHISELAMQMCHLKSEFKDWTSKQTKTPLHVDKAVIKRVLDASASAKEGNYYGSAAWKSPMYQSYLHTLSHIPRRMHGVGAVLYSVVDAVCHDPAVIKSCDKGGVPEIPENFRGLGLEDGSIGSMGEKPFHMLKQGYNVALKSLQSNTFTVQDGDAFHTRIITAKDILVMNDEADPEYAATTSIFGFERDAVFTGHVPRLIGQGGMPLHASISSKERSVQETELLTFTALSSFDFHRYNQLVNFNHMVERGVPPRVDFTGLRRGTDGGGDIASHKRKYFKNIPAFALPQILAKEIMKEPVVSREYYPLTDELLLCLYWPPPHRRLANRSWNPSKHMHLRPNFEEFMVFSERMNFTPRTAESVHSCLDIPSAEMQKYTEETVFITPADKSVVLVKKSCSVDRAWLTIHNKDVMLGLRQLAGSIESWEQSSEGLFFLHTDDDVRTSVFVAASAEQCPGKPDQNGTVCLTTLYPNELSVSVCSNGAVTICSPIVAATRGPAVTMPSVPGGPTKSPRKTPVGKPSTRVLNMERGTVLMAPEVKRLVCNAGCVVRYLDEGGPFTRDIYFPNGNRVLVRDMNNIELDDPSDRLPPYTYPVSGIMETILLEAPVIQGEDGPIEWTYVVLDAEGRVLYGVDTADDSPSREDQDRVMHQSTAIPNISRFHIDAETEALVTEYKDGRAICISKDDLQDVYFPDGTRLTTHPSGEMVFIEKAGHPTIEIDAEIDNISKRHSQGFTVPIAKGGDKTRTRLAMPDGSAVLIKYDTRVTATYNGSIRAVRRDKSVVYAVDGGIVSYISPENWNDQAKQDFEEEKKDAENKPRAVPLLKGHKRRQPKAVNIRTMNNTSITIGEMSSNMLDMSSDMRTADFKGTATNFAATSTSAADISGMVTKKKFQRRKPKQLAQLGMSASPKKPQSAKTDEQKEEIVSAPKSTAAKYSFDLNICQCVIEDHENNIFDIDLEENPTAPLISLAGEVDGCKPDAVAATNIEPRLFVIGRSADAIEVCRFEEIEEVGKALDKCSEDYVKYTSDIVCPPCNLGGSLQHSVFWHRKMLSSAGFSFGDIFAERPWVRRPRPAALSIALRKQYSRYLAAEDEQMRQQKSDIFSIKTFSESAPLSDEGYMHLKEDIDKWNKFRSERDKMELSFAIDDHRTVEEKKKEAEIMKKLKGMYKSAKVAKKKEAEKNKVALVKVNDALEPVLEEEGREEEDNASHEDDEEEELTPEEVELNDAFDAFAVKELMSVSVDEESVASSYGGVVRLEDLQDVFVQVFNRFIPFSYIADAYYDDTGLPLEEGEDLKIDYDQYRRIYFNLHTTFAAEEFAMERSTLGSGNNSTARSAVSTANSNMLSMTRVSTSPENVRFDFGALSSRRDSESAGSLGTLGATTNGAIGSARGSGIMAVRNMSKTLPN